MFADAGITWEPSKENDYRMTWTEFLDTCEKLKSKGYTPLGEGNLGGSMTSWYFTPITLNYVDEDDWQDITTGKMRWNDPKYIESMTRLYELHKAGYFNEGGLTLGWTEGINMVANKQAAMQVAPWGYNTKPAIDALGEDYGMMLPPVINEDNPVSHYVQGSWWARHVITTWSKHPEEAAEWIRFLSSDDQLAKFTEMNGGFAPTTGFDSSTIPDKYNQLAYEWMTTHKIYPDVSNCSWTTELFYEQRGKSIELFNDQITPQQWGDDLNARFEQLTYDFIVK